MRGWALLLAGLAACGGERAASAPADSPAGPAALSPVRASFVDLGEATLRTTSACDVQFVAVVSGEATVAEHKLAPFDVAVIDGKADVVVRGQGVVLVASYSPPECRSPRPSSIRAVRAGDASELTFAKGAMHAHLDVEGEPGVYFGRLSGSAPVAEHQHDGAWEIVCAVEAAGTMMLAGKPQRVEGGQVVVVPPDTKHSWQPDPGSNLVAFQLYTPPGPEQRFKKLAAGAK